MEVVLALGGLFATGIQVSEMLNRFVSAVINAPNNIRYLKSEVENFTGIVSVLQAKTTAQAPPNPLKVSPGNYFSAALDSARQTLSDLYRELDRIASHGSRLWEGIKYAYKEQTFSTLLLQLMNHKATLQLLVSLTSTESSEERCMIMRRFTRDSAVTDCESYVAAPTNVSSVTLINAGGNPHATRSSAFAHETSTRSVSSKPPPNHNPTASAPVIVTASPNVVPSVAIYPMPAPPTFTAPKYSLHEAVGKRDKRMVYYFLQLGHDVNQDHPELETPLAYAVWLGEAQIVTYLLLFGANVNVKNRLGRYVDHLRSS
ncbi:hypothetical protein P167DRAFT_116021 [Morchella conica CCBAS932]|uniref:Uncharacterized protein n=1 Tax=Morchella conica CCBAS932 TaxID=1392247 RepID=A0A3N4K7I3_9PEZI|nr:hypothetical protein P167DRAFT_116021 [Morchella conica CCBAS932]